MKILRLKDFRFPKEFLFEFLLFLVLLTAFAIRFFYLFTERMWPDEALYGWQAQKIFQNPSILFSKEIIEFHPPLFPSLLALGHLIFPPEMACRVVPFIINFLGILAIYQVGSKISSRFLGLFAALTLAFNYLYIADATHILIDGSLAVFILIFVLILLKREESRGQRGGFALGFIGSAVILLKWSGIILIPFLVSYYLLTSSRLNRRNRLKETTLPLGMMTITVLSLLVNNLVKLGHVLPNISALKGLYKTGPIEFYLVNLHNIFVIPIFIPLLVFGLLKCFDRTHPKRILLFIWFIIFLVAISFTPEKLLRYSLLIIPSGLLIIGLAIEDLLKKIVKTRETQRLAKFLCFLLVLLICFTLHPRANSLITKNVRTFTGFREAAHWIKTFQTPSTTIIAGSPRIIRYYTSIEFLEGGGRLVKIPLDRKTFQRILINTTDPVLLEIDSWEATQPSWIYPLDQEKIKYLNTLGFQSMREIKRSIELPGNRQQTIPVIWIFKRMGL